MTGLQEEGRKRNSLQEITRVCVWLESVAHLADARAVCVCVYCAGAMVSDRVWSQGGKYARFAALLSGGRAMQCCLWSTHMVMANALQFEVK